MYLNLIQIAFPEICSILQKQKVSRVSVLALLRFIDPLNRSFSPQEIGKHGIKGSIIALITIGHHIHVSNFVIFDPMVSDLSGNPAVKV